MSKLPAVKADVVICVLEKVGFQVVRQKSSHLQMKHEDGRVITIPVHAGKDLGSLLCKMLRAELTPEEL